MVCLLISIFMLCLSGTLLWLTGNPIFLLGVILSTYGIHRSEVKQIQKGQECNNKYYKKM